MVWLGLADRTLTSVLAPAAALARSGLPVLELPAALLRDDPAAARAKVAAFLGTDVAGAPLPEFVPGLPTMLPAGHATRYASALG